MILLWQHKTQHKTNPMKISIVFNLYVFKIPRIVLFVCLFLFLV